MKRHNKIVFAAILLAIFFALSAVCSFAFTNSQRDGVALWELVDGGILTDGITEYEPYLIGGEMVDLTALGYELTNKVYYYSNTVTLGGEEYDVVAAYDFAPVVFLEAIEPNESYKYPTYAYYSGDPSILDSFLGGSFEKVRAICYDLWSSVAFDISDDTLFNIKSGIDCTTKVIHMSELDEADWYWLYCFDKTDILAFKDNFLFKNQEDWCYLDTSLIPENYYYADGSLALDKDLSITVRVVTGEVKAMVEEAANDAYAYEIISENESAGILDNLFGTDWTEEETLVAVCVMVGIFGILVPLGLGIYSGIDILVFKKGQRNISSYVLAIAEGVWLVCGVVLLVVLVV